MFDPYNLLLLYTFIFLVASVILFVVAKKYPPLRKAWIVYSVMYVLHAIFFMGIWMSLPATFPVYRTKVEQVDSIETIAEVKKELQYQREEIESLTNDVHQINRSFFVFVFVLTLFGPMLYYNLIKYNLEIEKLSGKRMGSFD